MDRLAKLALGTALQKAVKAELDEIRADLAEEYREAFEGSGGADLRAAILQLGGTEVGKVTARHERPHKVGRLIVASDAQVEVEGALEFAEAHRREYFEWMAAQGIMPSGCQWVEEDVPSRFAGIQVTGCKPEEVARALGGELTQAVAGFLEA